MPVITDFRTYTVNDIFSILPDFIQTQDNNAALTNGHGPIWNFINSVAGIMDQQINVLARDSMGAGQGGVGADGTLDLENYLGAPGWSQIIDINRCPSYALPWLAQFVGVNLQTNNPLTYAQMIDKITNRSGFQRGTVASLISAFVSIINEANPTKPVQASQIIVMENMKYSSGYVQDNEGSMVILIPSTYFALNTYASVGAEFATYAVAEAFYSTYASATGSPIPITGNNYNNYIYRYRPAGMQIYVGGY